STTVGGCFSARGRRRSKRSKFLEELENDLVGDLRALLVHPVADMRNHHFVFEVRYELSLSFENARHHEQGGFELAAEVACRLMDREIAVGECFLRVAIDVAVPAAGPEETTLRECGGIQIERRIVDETQRTLGWLCEALEHC